MPRPHGFVMGAALRILIVDDSDEDADLCVHALQRAGVEASWRRVDSAETMRSALAEAPWDIVLADYHLPRFSGLAALELLRAGGCDVPLVLVSGTFGEEVAVSAMRAGANDYLLKDHLERLPAVVEREMREAAGRRERRRAEAALRETEAITRAIVNAAVDGIITIDERGSIKAFNPAAERLFGYGAAEVMGQNVTRLMPAPDRDRHDDYLAMYLRTGVQHIIGVGREVVGQRKDGTTFPMDLAVSEVVLGHRRLFAGIVRDLSQRHYMETSLRESERRFAQFMHHLPGVAFMKDFDGRYVYVNEAFEELFHRKLADYIGRTDDEVWSPSIAAQLRSNDRRVMETRTVLQATEVIPHDDGPHHWLVTKFPIPNSVGEPVMVGGIAIDVTERRRAEAELRELQKVAQQRERLADIGAITAQIVHDLGNPLAGVSMQAQLILRRAKRDPGRPVSTIVSAVERILTEVRRLDSLTKEFMEFSREQRLELRAVDLRRFLQRVVDLWQPVAAARAIAINFESPREVPRLTADEEKLHRVFDNLVKNAIEAIDRGPGHVAIQVTRPEVDAVRISVSDSGPGIPETVQVFRLFETTKPQGSGIGLAVARQIVLAHHGSIECTRVAPRGTVFHVDLPCDNRPT
jgi:PAS domain S-box-containing protein